MSDTDDGIIAAASPNDRPYSARSNHTIAFAKLVMGYAELYDKWESIASHARSKRDEADRDAQAAQKLREQVEAVAASIRAHMIEKSRINNVA
jgi:hypothetical protein